MELLQRSCGGAREAGHTERLTADTTSIIGLFNSRQRGWTRLIQENSEINAVGLCPRNTSAWRL